MQPRPIVVPAHPAASTGRSTVVTMIAWVDALVVRAHQAAAILAEPAVPGAFSNDAL